MNNNIEYVLPLGKPNAEGVLTSASWQAFVQWIFRLADHLVIWTQCSRADVIQWLGVEETAEIVAIAHPDPACTLVGYRMPLKVLRYEPVSRARVSEDTGVAFFSWQKGDVVLASVELDDFENFAILNVERADAKQLANACWDDSWDDNYFRAYKAEIDGICAMGHWVPLSNVLDSRS
jgi:hypothetical protein